MTITHRCAGKTAELLLWVECSGPFLGRTFGASNKKNAAKKEKMKNMGVVYIGLPLEAHELRRLFVLLLVSDKCTDRKLRPTKPKGIGFAYLWLMTQKIHDLI